MKPSTLRAFIIRYGAAGTLLVGGYMLICHLVRHRRQHLIIGIVIVLAGAAWIATRPMRHYPVHFDRDELRLLPNRPVSPHPIIMATTRIDPGVVGKVAFIRDRSMWYAPISRDGRLLHAPQRIAGVRPGAISPEMAWSSDGRLLAYSENDGAKLFIVELCDGAKPISLGPGDQPAFSPNNSRLAFACSAYDKNSIFTVDLRTGARKLVRSEALDPSWSADGKFLVVRDNTDGSLNDSTLLLEPSTGRIVSRLNKTEGQQPRLSPNGRYLASCVSLSRPKVAPTILDVATGKVRDVPHEGDPDLCWSPDSRWLGWGRWRVDPNNDGCYTALEVWITSPTDGASRKIGNGYSPRFAPDGKHLLFVEANGYYKSGSLVVADVKGHHKATLAARIDSELAVWIRPRP